MELVTRILMSRNCIIFMFVHTTLLCCAQHPSRMYWVQQNGFGDNDVYRSNIDGTEVEWLLNANVGIPQLALDSPRNELYVADNGNLLVRLNLETLTRENVFNAIFADPPSRVFEIIGLKLDETRDTVFILLTPFSGSDSGGIYRCNSDLTLGLMEDLEPVILEPYGKAIALDISHKKIYISSIRPPYATPYSSTIRRCNYDGSMAELVIEVPYYVNNLSFDLVKNELIFCAEGRLKKVELNTGTFSVQEIPTIGTEYITSVSVDSLRERLFWTDGRTHKIQSSNLEGGEIRDLLTTSLIYAPPTEITVESNNYLLAVPTLSNKGTVIFLLSILVLGLCFIKK